MDLGRFYTSWMVEQCIVEVRDAVVGGRISDVNLPRFSSVAALQIWVPHHSEKSAIYESL